MLQLRNVGKNYGSIQALRHIELMFSRGFYGLLGHNGAGKTTLLRIMAGLLAPDTGALSRTGRPLASQLRHHRDRTGFLPQDFAPYPDLTVRQLLTYVAGIKSIPASLAQARISEVLGQVELEGEVNTLIAELSGGMIKQLGLACALCNDPDLLLLDEPFNGLDAFIKRRLSRLLQQLSVNRTVIVSSHVTDDLEGVADHVAIMQSGTVKAMQRPEQMVIRLSGRVWELNVFAEEELIRLQQEYFLPRVRLIEGGYRVRLVGKPPAGLQATPAVPQLEDVFLALTEPTQPVI